MKSKKKFTLVETFVGAGGSHLGFKLAGFKTVYANDSDSDMIKTFKKNNPRVSDKIIDERPIQKIKAKEILKKSNLKKGELDVLFGGIVCCGFSLAGVRDPSDKRNTLYKEQLRLVANLMPKISIIENVPTMQNAFILKRNAPKKLKEKVAYIHQKLEDFKGIKAERRKKNLELSSNEKKEYEKIKKEKKEIANMVKKYSIGVIADLKKIYDKLGYSVYVEKLNAAWYGAATNRTRIIVVAVRKNLNIKFRYPKIKYWSESKNKNNVPKEIFSKKFKKFKTVRDALKEIDCKDKNNPKKDRENLPMQHKSKSVERFRLISRGKNIVDVMDKIPESLKISRYYSRGCTMRLCPNKPAPTLVPGHSNFPIHPYKDRSITIREAAIITGFSGNYKFHGNHTKRCLQVGNAVPPPLAHAIAVSAKNAIKQYYKTKRR